MKEIIFLTLGVNFFCFRTEDACEYEDWKGRYCRGPGLSRVSSKSETRKDESSCSREPLETAIKSDRVNPTLKPEDEESRGKRFCEFHPRL